MGLTGIWASVPHADSYACLEQAKDATQKLVEYCLVNNFEGYDPYDALNSKIFGSLPILNSRVPRILLTQIMKRSPINLRHLARIPKTQNPKGIALFLSAFIRLTSIRIATQGDFVALMIERLINLRSPGVPYWCWGYSFAWQGRAVLVPRGAPNLVCTTFVADALLDAYEQNGQTKCLGMAVSAAEYILNELYWTDGNTAAAGFSYPLPSIRSQTHNATFLASALLCRLYKQTGDEKFLGPALKAARYSAAKQSENGSWRYGEAPSQSWIDNFHTGFNLCALQRIGRYLDNREFEPCIRRGFSFYRDHFFREDGAARYFHNRTYPIDSHCVAQSIITLILFRNFDPDNVFLACSVFQWAMKHMWDDRGFFYYRVLRACTIRTSYMRWTQAWMLLALSVLLCELSGVVKQPQASPSFTPVEREP